MRPVLLALAILVLAAPAQARSLRLFDDGPAIRAATDGRGVAWVETALTGRVRVLRPSGSVRTIPAPPGCTFAAFGSGELLWSCASGDGSTGRALDLATGATQELSRQAPDPRSGADFAQYDGIGRRWTRVVLTGYKTRIVRYADRVTGAIRSAPTSALRTADLDAPGLSRRLCAPVRRLPELDANGLGVALPPELTLTGGAAVSGLVTDDARHSSRIVLQRCGHRPRTVERCPDGSCDAHPVLVAGQVATRRVGAIVVRSLRTRRLRRASVVGYPVMVGAVGHRLYLVERGRLKHVIV